MTSALGSNGSTWSWRKTRRRVLERDGWACQLRGPSCTGLATTADHVVPRKLGGTDDDWNLQAACAKCNGSKGDRLAPSGAAQVFRTGPTPSPPVSLSLPGMGDETRRTDHLEG